MSEQSHENVGKEFIAPGEFKRIDDADDENIAQHAAKAEYVARESHDIRSAAAEDRKHKGDEEYVPRALFGSATDEESEQVEKAAAEDYDFAQNMRGEYESMPIEDLEAEKARLQNEITRLEREKKKASLLQGVVQEVIEVTAQDVYDDRK